MHWTADFLIVGSGIAGLRAAAELAPAGDVLVLTKADASESNTGYAQGGIAAAVGPDDSPERHGADTIRAGDGLCDEAAVSVLVGEGPRYVQQLIAWGARFDRHPDGGLDLGREGAHSVRRVLHAGDSTGREIGRVLWERASAARRIRVLENTLATDLVIEGGRCAGVRFLDRAGGQATAIGRATLLATGGAGQIFRETTNPRVATGDGIAMAYRAGARVADLEFVQFHPTALNVVDAPRFLISEAVRGEGARLVNSRGETFMTRYDPSGDLASRDVVSRAIARESDLTGSGVWLSLGELDAEFVHRRFPMISEMCRQLGLDLARDLIPVGPAAHYIMGGVQTDLDARTSIPGLFAAGEVACTGVHGANRLASNSLLEGLVFGARAASAMLLEPPVGLSVPVDPLQQRAQPQVVELGEDELRDLMWRCAGVFRDEAGLRVAVTRLDAAWEHVVELQRRGTSFDWPGWRLVSLITVGRLIARAALRRRESRGAHFRADFPFRDDDRWKEHVAEALDPQRV